MRRSARSRSSSTAKGPVLFRQKRYGFNNELIEVFKFRSMYVDRPMPKPRSS